METTILAPAAVLVLWTLIMMLWMLGTRLPALSMAGMGLSKMPAGGRGQDVDGIVPQSVAWKSHNYTNLLEQPTIFYAVVGILTLAGQGHGVNTMIAWAYVALRIVHSLWQALVNTIPIRGGLFLLSTLCLLALSIHAVIATI